MCLKKKIKACKHVLVESQNTSTDLKKEHGMSPFKVAFSAMTTNHAATLL